jgi:hypothetical protein
MRTARPARRQSTSTDRSLEIDVPDEDAEQIGTVRQLIEYVTFEVDRTQKKRTRAPVARDA